MPRVAITGVGLVTPLGLSAAENVARSCRGESAIGPARAIDVQGHAATALAAVPDFELESFLRFPKNFKFMSRAVQFAMRAAREAIDQSGLDPGKMDATRVGIQVGSGQTGVEYDHFFPSLIMAWDAGREMDYKYLGGLPSHLIDRYICLRTLANGGLALLSTEFGIRGPNGNFTQKDTASALALNAAYLDLLEGRCDVSVAGGYDSLATAGNFLAYEQAGLLSHADPAEAYRPLDGEADGLVLGEGAGFLVLERWEHAEARGATALGEFHGAAAGMSAIGQWRPACRTGGPLPGRASGYPKRTSGFCSGSRPWHGPRGPRGNRRPGLHRGKPRSGHGAEKPDRLHGRGHRGRGIGVGAVVRAAGFRARHCPSSPGSRGLRTRPGNRFSAAS